MTFTECHMGKSIIERGENAMKDVLRKTLALLLCFCMCLSLIPAAFAEEGI